MIDKVVGSEVTIEALELTTSASSSRIIHAVQSRTASEDEEKAPQTRHEENLLVREVKILNSLLKAKMDWEEWLLTVLKK